MTLILKKCIFKKKLFNFIQFLYIRLKFDLDEMYGEKITIDLKINVDHFLLNEEKKKQLEYSLIFG